MSNSTDRGSAAKRQELRDLLVELSRWSGVAEKNGDLHARIASALALESSAAEESVGERQGRRPAQDLGQNDAKSVILSSWEKADPLSDPTSGQGANAKPGLSDAPSRDAATGLEPDEHALLETVVGKRLTGFEQAPNRGHFDSGDWRDDEPLYLTFEDGSRIAVYARGWHDSGGLYVESA